MFYAQIVGDHKYTINETTHVRKTNFGDVFFKVRTVDVQPVDVDDTTEPREVDTTNGVDFDIDNIPTTLAPPPEIPETFDTREGADDENDERRTVDDGTVDIDSPELSETDDSVGNEISRDILEQLEVK